MNPELVQQVQRQHLEHHAWRKPQPHQRREEQRRAAEPPEDADAVGRTQVEFVGRVVHRVVAPEPAHPMRGAVVPVVAELLADEQRQHGHPAVQRNGVHPVLVSPHDQRHGDAQRQKYLQADAQHQVKQ